MSFDKLFEKYVEIRKVEFKDGAIWRTHHLRYEWVPMDTQMYSINDKHEQVCNVSSSVQAQMNYNTIRRIKQ